MKLFSNIAIIASALALTTGAIAQTQLKVSTGGPTGTYSRMFKEFASVCKDQILQVEMPSKGSVENMDRLLDNTANAALVQTDVLFYRSRNEDLGNIKTLFALYPEEVHVITTAVSTIMEGGTLGLGKKPAQFNTVSDLNGRSVAAWGGSIVTAQVIRLQSEINYTVVEVNDFKSARAALDAGQVAAIIMVGGQPMDDVKTLDKNYKLLTFNEATVSKLKSVYSPAKLNYSNLGIAGTGVQTISSDALFVTRAYKTPKYTESLAALRSCFVSHIAELQETTGAHPKWQKVDVDNHGKWSYYQLDDVKFPVKKK